jgi:hypothetical protein
LKQCSGGASSGPASSYRLRGTQSTTPEGAGTPHRCRFDSRRSCQPSSVAPVQPRTEQRFQSVVPNFRIANSMGVIRSDFQIYIWCEFSQMREIVTKRGLDKKKAGGSSMVAAAGKPASSTQRRRRERWNAGGRRGNHFSIERGYLVPSAPVAFSES